MRVGAAGRLNSALEPSLRDYTLLHSSTMFQRSYQPQRLKEDIAGILFGSLGGSNGDEKLIHVLRNASLTRDERAHVNPTAEDMAEFEQRKDI
ncbi:Uu.00g129580.m01.CDS01 [Anthostomella pinea]|uniref:Uu.00g129580.m01.CDS01 n=1 Tax=Anthostomella pinea TaxID=933095 RepID=A0AAI8YI29_9PEZI|nr:Uu.00g129580.m01.CDS01 [Anthostomella pinea]